MTKGYLHIITTPVGGDIFVNNEYRGTKDINIELEQGAYIVTFGNVAGYKTPPPLNVTVNPGYTALVTIPYTI